MAKRNQGVVNTLARVASEHGLPLDVLYRFAHIESSFNPKARTGSYKGLFQLSNSEFRKWGGGNIYDPEDNARAFARLLKNNAAYLMKQGIKPEGWMLYLAHQQGIAGGPAHVQNPSQAAWVNMYNTPEGRRKGVRWAKRAIWGNIPKGQRRRFGKVENVKSADFVDLWQARYDRASGASVKEVAFDASNAKSPDLPTRGTAPRIDRTENFRTASKELKLNKRERALYKRHLKNLYADVSNVTEGQPYSLMASTVTHRGQTYIIPTVWDGKILKPDEAELRAKRLGLRHFPRYKSVAEAEARYKQFHEYMDKDADLWKQVQIQRMASVPERNERQQGVPQRRGIKTIFSRLPQGAELQAEPEPDSSLAMVPPELPSEPIIPPDDGEDKAAVMPGRRGRFSLGRTKKDEAPTGGFTPDLAERAFGSPFGELYARPDQGERLLGSVPQGPPLLRDIFGSG